MSQLILCHFLAWDTVKVVNSFLVICVPANLPIVIFTLRNVSNLALHKLVI